MFHQPPTSITEIDICPFICRYKDAIKTYSKSPNLLYDVEILLENCILKIFQQTGNELDTIQLNCIILFLFFLSSFFSAIWDPE